jgi:DNA-binding GntR family transcriptional regulator
MAEHAAEVVRQETVTDRLRDMIIRGRVAPGVRVTEVDLARRFGVSRTPAREAIQRLVQEGFLLQTRTLRRVEVIVAPMTAEDMWDLYLIMASLEGSAALAVERLEPAELRALTKDLQHDEEKFERTARGVRGRVDFDTVFDLHNSFHTRLVAIAKRPRLQAMIAGVRPQVDRYEWIYAPLVGPDFSDTFTEHADIIRAVRTGSGKRARSAVATNWERGAARLARVIGSAGSRGDW